MQKYHMDMARARKQKRDANKRYQELNREVKRRCKGDKRVYMVYCMWNQKLRKLKRLEREVMQGICKRSPESYWEVPKYM